MWDVYCHRIPAPAGAECKPRHESRINLAGGGHGELGEGYNAESEAGNAHRVFPSP